MDLISSAVTYDGLPVSSGGAHTLRRTSATAAFAAWTHFLATCTEASPIRCWFDFPRTPELHVDPAVVERVAHDFPPDEDGRHSVGRARVDDALALFTSLEPLPVNSSGMAPIWLWFTTDFRLRSPRDSALWPGQDPARFGEFETPGGVRLGASSTRLILHARPLLGLRLSIPEASDDDLAAIVPWLQAELPMRLSSKHWTRWTLTSGGRSYRGRRITPTAALT
jgi:hypothetical protein